MTLEEAGQGPFWVYVLHNSSTGRRYTGQTDNLSGRIAQHNSFDHNPVKFTSKNPGPWLLLYAESQPA